MNNTFCRHLFLQSLFIITAFGLTACGDGGWFGSPEKAPLKGERIDALDFERSLTPDTNTAITAFHADDTVQNDTWPQAGGYTSHAMKNLALSNGALKKVWSVSIGSGSKSSLPLTAQPIVMGESIFTLDTADMLASFDTKTGKRRWAVNVGDPKEDDKTISGGIASDNGLIFVTAGYNEVLAVDAINGKIKWRSKTQSPARAAPTIMDGRVFVTTLNNSILSLSPVDGSVQWEFSGIAAQTGIVGAASPAATSDLVIPAFSSGEIYALRSINGSVAWSDNLSGALRLGGLGALSDIRGLPVVDNNVVYAISFAGKIAAIDLVSGLRVWQRDISGSKTPWVSGNRLFVISNQAEIISLDKQKGSIIWVSQLARYKDKGTKSGPIIWTGPIMGGGRLFAFSSDGRIAEIDAEKGTLIRETRNGESMSLSPIIAGGALYILSEDGTLGAYR